MIGSLLAEAGWLMAPIYACSFFMVILVVQKSLEIRAARLKDFEWMPTTAELSRGESVSVAGRCSEHVHPAAKAVGALLKIYPRRPDMAETEAGRVGRSEIVKLEKNISGLAFIAQAAPLLGLLGTVIGMVELFMAIQGAGGGEIEPALLSAGIWKALLTTAAGLVVAVPALGAYVWFSGRIDLLRLQVRDAVERVLSELPVPSESASVSVNDSEEYSGIHGS